jgi:hypothetical protein
MALEYEVDIATEYWIEQGVFAVLALIVWALFVRANVLEYNQLLAVSELSRVYNRVGLTLSILMLVICADPRSVHNFIPAQYSSWLYGNATCLVNLAIAVYLFLSVKTIALLTMRHCISAMRSFDEHHDVKVFRIILASDVLFVFVGSNVRSVTLTLSNESRFQGMWLIALGCNSLLLLFLFLYKSYRLQGLMWDHLDDLGITKATIEEARLQWARQTSRVRLASSASSRYRRRQISLSSRADVDSKSDAVTVPDTTRTSSKHTFNSTTSSGSRQTSELSGVGDASMMQRIDAANRRIRLLRWLLTPVACGSAYAQLRGGFDLLSDGTVPLEQQDPDTFDFFKASYLWQLMIFCWVMIWLGWEKRLPPAVASAWRRGTISSSKESFMAERYAERQFPSEPINMINLDDVSNTDGNGDATSSTPNDGNTVVTVPVPVVNEQDNHHEVLLQQ